MAQNFSDGSKFIAYYGKDLVEKATDLYKLGHSMRSIEKELGIKRQSLSQYLSMIGVKTTAGNHFRKYYHDFDFFEKIDSEEKSYWLGFMYADGYLVNPPAGKTEDPKFGITLKVSDHSHLEKFKKALHATNPIHDYPRYKGSYENGEGTCKLLMTSKKTCDDLAKNGCFFNKTRILKFPSEEIVSKELMPHFIRGYLDGDGSIVENRGSYQIQFCGTKDFIEGLRKEMPYGGNIFPEKRSDFIYYYSLGGNKQVLATLDWIYNNASVFLERKYQRYHELKMKYAEKQGTNG